MYPLKLPFRGVPYKIEALAITYNLLHFFPSPQCALRMLERFDVATEFPLKNWDLKWQVATTLEPIGTVC